MTDQTPTGIGYCVVELLGHRRTGAYVTEAALAGASFLRLDIPATPGHEPMTQYVSPGSVYCLTPTTEEIAVKAAAIGRPAPVSRWELASIQASPADPHGRTYGDEDDISDSEAGPF